MFCPKNDLPFQADYSSSQNTVYLPKKTFDISKITSFFPKKHFIVPKSTFSLYLLHFHNLLQLYPT